MKHNRATMLLLCVLILVFGAAGSAVAQSGRRAKQSATPPPPVQAPAESEAETPVKPAPQPEAKGLPLIVIADEGSSMSVPFGSSRLVLDGFVARLRKSSAFEYRVEKQMGRKEARDRAKEQTESHVVWLQFGSDGMSARSNASDLYVEYIVFMPETAKSKSSGRVYLRNYRRNVGVGGVGLPLPPSGNRTGLEYALQQAGADAAERVMAAFDVTAR